MKPPKKTISETETASDPAIAYSNMSMRLFLVENAISQTRKGLNASHLQLIRKQTELELQELAKITQVTTRTLHNKKNDEPLGTTASEKLISLMRLFKRGTEVFGSEQSFKKWLKTSLPVLKNETPLQQLDTVFGFELVSDMLGKIEHGVLA
jgi:putative toxin-antitoxin system antitoxin component (TIGR02293 family)